MRTIRARLLTLVLWCFAAPLAGAVSTYDVIELSRQGYSDEQLVDIVRITGSVFKLAAEDIPRLKELGVSETVIREMLQSGRGSTGSIEQQSAAFFDDSGSNNTPRRFSLQATLDENAGDGQRLYVAVLGAPVLILGSRGQHRSVEDRGAAIVRSLDEAVRLGDGGFRLLRTGDVVQVVYHSAKLREIPIITLDRQDTDDYGMRSKRRITAEVLAAYWAALLNDYWAIAVQHRAPSRLVKLRDGVALKDFFERVHTTDAGQDASVELAGEQLQPELRQQLERLASTVPDDYRAYPGLIADSS